MTNDICPPPTFPPFPNGIPPNGVFPPPLCLAEITAILQTTQDILVIGILVIVLLLSAILITKLT